MIRQLTMVWAVLLVLYGIEVLLTLNHLGVYTPFLAATMLGLMAWYFMRLRESSQLIRIFAFAGVFWLAILICLGISDPFTRFDRPVLIETTR